MQAVKSPQVGTLENVTVRTADGRVYNLGNPNSWLFRFRVFMYRARRAVEFWRASR